jgi:MFS family permease
LYSYSAYSADLQALLGYTGTQVNILSSIGDLGLYVGGIPMGFFFDRFGPRLTYVKCAVCLFIGYTLMWAGSIQKLPSNSIMMGLYMTFVGYGSVAGYMAGLLTNTKNSPPEQRGKIIAFLVAAYGLSAAIFSQIYHHTFNHDVAKFFWLLALILGVLPLLGIGLVKYVPIPNHNANQTKASPGPSASSDSLFPIETDSPIALETETNPEPSHALYSAGKYGDLKGILVLRSPDFLLLFAIVFCCTGVGLTWINIIGNIVKSYKITAIPASMYVIGLSIANALGRILFGLLTDLKHVPLPPIYLMIPCLAILIFTHGSLIWATNYIWILIVTLLTGLSYGGSFAIMPVIINRYFGDKNYGSNLGLLILAVAIGSMAMGAISGAIYDHEASRQKSAPTAVLRALSSSPSSHLCFGIDCFRWTYVMTTCVSIIGLIISIVLLKREMTLDARIHQQEDFESLENERQ